MRLAHPVQQACQELLPHRRQRIDARRQHRHIAMPQADMVMRATGAFFARRLEPRHEGGNQPAFGAKLAQMQLGPHRIIRRLDRRFWRQGEFIHAIAVFGHKRGDADAERLHPAHEFAHQILIVAAAHQIVIDQRMPPGLQLAVAALLHQRVIGMEDAEFIFQRHLGRIAQLAQPRVGLRQNMPGIHGAGAAVEHIAIGDDRAESRPGRSPPEYSDSRCHHWRWLRKRRYRRSAGHRHATRNRGCRSAHRPRPRVSAG